MNYKGAWTCFFLFVCFSGFIFQVKQVSELYFRYQTTSKTKLEIRETEYYQTISFCPRFTELLDRSNQKKFGLRASSPFKGEDVYEDLKHLTIRDILELTPPESNVVHYCSRRETGINTLISMNQMECESFFNVTKSVNGERICYTFMPKKKTGYSVGDVASSQTYTNTVYQIYLQPSLQGAVVGFFISEFVDPENFQDPLDSRLYQVMMWNTDGFDQSMFAVLGESVEISTLPSPHDTQCTPDHKREVCYEICVIKKFKAVNRIPWSGYHREKQNTKMLTPFDLENATTSKLAMQAYHECHQKCKLKTQCHIVFSKTFVYNYLNKSTSFSLALMSMVPSGPTMSLYSVPVITVVEYIIQIGSCFGVWFGLSIISFNPAKWKILKKKEPPLRVVCHCQKTFFASSWNTRHIHAS